MTNLNKKTAENLPEESGRKSGSVRANGIGTRIKKISNMLGGNSATARSIHKSDIQIGRYIREESAPSIDVVVALAKTASVSIQWLATGEGPMRLDSPACSSPATTLDDDEFTLIPRCDVRASAGAGSLVDNETMVSKLAFRTDWLIGEMHLTPAQLRLIEVQGDSMEPTIRQDDVILVDMTAANTLTNDGIYVLRIDDSLMVKRLQRLPGNRAYVVSDNSAYKSYKLDLNDPHSGLAIVGRVVWAGTIF